MHRSSGRPKLSRTTREGWFVEFGRQFRRNRLKIPRTAASWCAKRTTCEPPCSDLKSEVLATCIEPMPASRPAGSCRFAPPGGRAAAVSIGLDRSLTILQKPRAERTPDEVQVQNERCLVDAGCVLRRTDGRLQTGRQESLGRAGSQYDRLVVTGIPPRLAWAAIRADCLVGDCSCAVSYRWRV